ncbi:MAG: lmo0937 family membrane protein [Acidobacteriaceae bacterium]
MFWTAFVLLLAGWLLGVVGYPILGSYTHILLVVAIVAWLLHYDHERQMHHP